MNEIFQTDEYTSSEYQFSRTERLIGRENMERLKKARVAVFGIGGVGGYVVEALARSGVGSLDLIDSDRVCLSNLNRQIIATHKTLGRYKVEAARERILEINPQAEVRVYPVFYLPETAEQFDFTQYDYVVDAIDTVAGKLSLAEAARDAHVPMISSMGAGNKMDAAAFQVADISETSVCPLARVMRRELKKRGIEHLKVVYSREKPLTPSGEEGSRTQSQGQIQTLSQEDAPLTPSGEETQRKQTPGSNAFVPSVAGLIMAGEVVKDLIAWQS